MSALLQMGIGRSFDLIMYVLYSDDQIFIKDMVTKVTMEVIEEYNCNELRMLITQKENNLLYKCLFFFMLDFQPQFRYWVLHESDQIGLKPICPEKALRFLKCLRDEILQDFIVNETIRLDDLERAIKVEYIRS